MVLVMALLIQAAAAQPGDRPVRVWLDPSGPVAPGGQVQVYVKTAVDGYLIVLRSATDRRIEVLFPKDPADEAFVPAGSYEVRRADGATFAVLEPPGTGYVVAALSPTPFRPDEFVHQASWNPGTLTGSWSGADAEGTLTDIVQRLLGDGYFNYDVVAYTVAPRSPIPHHTPVADPGFATCLGCSFTYVTIVQPVVPVFCDPFLFFCDESFPIFQRRPPPVVTSGICRIGIDCPEGVGQSARAFIGRPESRASVAPRGTRPPQFVIPQRPASRPSIVTRPRAPDQAGPARVAVAARAIPLASVRRVSQAPQARARTPAPSGSPVRLMMPRTRPRPAAPAIAQAPSVRSLVTAPAPSAVAPAARAAIAIAWPTTRAAAAVPAMVAPVRPRSVQAAQQAGATDAPRRPGVVAVPRTTSAGTSVRAARAAARPR